VPPAAARAPLPGSEGLSRSAGGQLLHKRQTAGAGAAVLPSGMAPGSAQEQEGHQEQLGRPSSWRKEVTQGHITHGRLSLERAAMAGVFANAARAVQPTTKTQTSRTMVVTLLVFDAAGGRHSIPVSPWCLDHSFDQSLVHVCIHYVGAR
jgi:hypothetical protein